MSIEEKRSHSQQQQQDGAVSLPGQNLYEALAGHEETTTVAINAGHSANKDICIFSYNSREFSKLKQEYCCLLLSEQTVGNKIPILCNQENFITRGIIV